MAHQLASLLAPFIVTQGPVELALLQQYTVDTGRSNEQIAQVTTVEEVQRRNRNPVPRFPTQPVRTAPTRATGWDIPVPTTEPPHAQCPTAKVTTENQQGIIYGFSDYSGSSPSGVDVSHAYSILRSTLMVVEDPDIRMTTANTVEEQLSGDAEMVPASEIPERQGALNFIDIQACQGWWNEGISR